MGVTPASKYEGVTKSGDRWRARIYVNGRRQSLGLFKTEIEAYQAYLNFKKRHRDGKENIRVSTTNDTSMIELCGSCVESLVDASMRIENMKIKNPNIFIYVNDEKVYFCDDKCMRYYVSQPEIWARYNELGFL